MDLWLHSTWTERIGFVAAQATLNKMAEVDAQKKLIYFGERINTGWTELARKYSLDISIGGIPPLTHITFKGNSPRVVQTLCTQEMLTKGFLVGSSVNTTSAYTDEIIDLFVENSDHVFRTIKVAEDSGTLNSLLRSDVAHSGFKRLTA
jgi:glutamate-1-semialdehyde 2,1-aminomutase